MTYFVVGWMLADSGLLRGLAYTPCLILFWPFYLPRILVFLLLERLLD